MSPGLKRAREPYRLKNALVGITLGAVSVGIWAYSISAVKQDIYDDMDDEVEVLAAPLNAPSPAVAAPTQKAADVPVSNHSALKDAIILKEPNNVEKQAKPRGVLQQLEGRLPWLLDSKSKTLVSGAPPVDNIGKMSRS